MALLNANHFLMDIVEKSEEYKDYFDKHKKKL